MYTAPANETFLETVTGALAATPIRLDGSLGAVLIGLIVSSMLFGITNVQCLIYYQSSSSDRRVMRWTVMFLWLLDAFHLALISHTMYRYLVTDFGSLLAITRSAWSLCLQVIITVTIACTVSLFYAYRVWIMSNRNRILTFGALSLNFVVLVSGFAFGIKMFTFKSVLEIPSINWLAYISLGTAVASNLWSALCLCYFLARDRTGFSSTDTKLNTLMLYVISTGLLTSMVLICILVLIAAVPRGYSYIAVYICLCKIDFNALLVMLNGRNYMRQGMSVANDQRTYQLPQIVNIRQPSPSILDSSFDTAQTSSDKMFSPVYKAYLFVGELYGPTLSTVVFAE